MYLSTNASLFFLIILIPAAIAAAWFYYRKSNISRQQKIFMTALRAVSFTALFILLLNPVLHYFTSKKNTPINIFLSDKSKSMKITGGDSALIETEDRIKKIFHKDENVFFNFADRLYPPDLPADSIDDNSTNLSSAFDGLFAKYTASRISSVNIISDGNFNAGGNPSYIASRFNIPVNYFLAGDTSMKKDVLISNVNYNKENFIESVSPVKVTLNSYKINGQEKVTLYEDGKEISTQVIELRNDKNIYEVNFSAASEKVGIKRYTVKCDEVQGEATNKNNFRDFYLKFSDNKFNITVISGAPSADFALLKNELDKIGNFRIKYLTLKNSGSFYEGVYSAMNDVQCVILQSFPSVQAGEGLINQISDDIVKFKIPVFFIDGSSTDLNKLKILENVLPFSLTVTQPDEIQSGLRSVSNQVYKYGDLVNGFPAVFLKANSFTARAGSEIYILSEKLQLPVLTVYKSGEIRAASFLAYNYYKWRLSRAVYDYSSFFNDMLTKTVSGIVEAGNTKIKLTPDNEVLSPNMNDGFTVEVKNSGNVQTSVKVNISGNNQNREIYVSKINENLYKGNFRQGEKGEYTITAELYENGIKTSQDERKILVDENNLEYMKTCSSNELLANMSSLTGGKKYTIDEISELKSTLDSIQQSGKTTYNAEDEFDFRKSTILFGIVILPVLIEWFFRKKIYNLR